MAVYVLPELDYPYDALEPHISAEIMEGESHSEASPGLRRWCQRCASLAKPHVRPGHGCGEPV